MRSTEDFISEVHIRAEQRLKERRVARKKLLSVGLPLAACFVIVIYVGTGGHFFSVANKASAPRVEDYADSYSLPEKMADGEALKRDEEGTKSNSIGSDAAQSGLEEGNENFGISGVPESIVGKLSGEAMRVSYSLDSSGLVAAALVAENHSATARARTQKVGEWAVAEITSKAQLTHFVKVLREANIIDSGVETKLNGRGEDFFEQKSVVLGYLPVPTLQTTVEFCGARMVRDRLVIDVKVNEPDGGDTAMAAYLVVVDISRNELEKAVTVEINDALGEGEGDGRNSSGNSGGNKK